MTKSQKECRVEASIFKKLSVKIVKNGEIYE